MRLARIWAQIYPRLQKPDLVNPPEIFAVYQRCLDQLAFERPSVEDARLLEVAWKLFDQESARRTSIDTRAGGVLPATSIVASLIVGVGFGALKDVTTFNRVVIYIAFTISLLFLGRSILNALRVQGSVARYTLGPDDVAPLPPAPLMGPSSYERRIARKLIEYTIQNYKINNMQVQSLRVAQENLRNAIVTIIAGGLIAAAYSFYSLLIAAPLWPLED